MVIKCSAESEGGAGSASAWEVLLLQARHEESLSRTHSAITYISALKTFWTDEISHVTSETSEIVRDAFPDHEFPLIGPKQPAGPSSGRVSSEEAASEDEEDQESDESDRVSDPRASKIGAPRQPLTVSMTTRRLSRREQELQDQISAARKELDSLANQSVRQSPPSAPRDVKRPRSVAFAPLEGTQESSAKRRKLPRPAMKRASVPNPVINREMIEIDRGTSEDLDDSDGAETRVSQASSGMTGFVVNDVNPEVLSADREGQFLLQKFKEKSEKERIVKTAMNQRLVSEGLKLLPASEKEKLRLDPALISTVPFDEPRPPPRVSGEGLPSFSERYNLWLREGRAMFNQQIEYSDEMTQRLWECEREKERTFKENRRLTAENIALKEEIDLLQSEVERLHRPVPEMSRVSGRVVSRAYPRSQRD